jgi:hypothetical protein
LKTVYAGRQNLFIDVWKEPGKREVWRTIMPEADILSIKMAKRCTGTLVSWTRIRSSMCFPNLGYSEGLVGKGSPYARSISFDGEPMDGAEMGVAIAGCFLWGVLACC